MKLEILSLRFIHQISTDLAKKVCVKLEILSLRFIHQISTDLAKKVCVSRP